MYRGWWVAAGGFIMAFYGWGVAFYGHGFYMVVLGRSTGWSVATLSSIVSVFWLANVAASLVLGRIIDRFGARPVVVYGALAMAAGCLALAAFETGYLEERWQLFAIFALMGSAYPGLAAMAVSAALLPWFRRRLGLALGIALTGASAGGAVMPPLMAWASARYGFGPAMTGIGAALILSVLPVAALLVRHPKGREAAEETGPAAGDPMRTAIPARRILGSVRFWTVASASGLSPGAQIGFLMHQIPASGGCPWTVRSSLGRQHRRTERGVGPICAGNAERPFPAAGPGRGLLHGPGVRPVVAAGRRGTGLPILFSDQRRVSAPTFGHLRGCAAHRRRM